MKSFNDFESASKYVKKIIDKGSDNAKEIVAEQVFKDSNEFTYRESGDVYKSGETNSNFKEGVIIERSPYVRRRYYEGGNPGAGNKQAQPRWFDKTVNKNKKDYIKQVGDCLNKAKKEV